MISLSRVIIAIEIRYFGTFAVIFHDFFFSHKYTHIYLFYFYMCQYSFLVHDNGALKTTGIIMCIMVEIIGEKIWCIRTVFLYLMEDAPSESTYYW